MPGTSSIEWTDATWNPARGCSRISTGCENCYAERFAHRFAGAGLPFHGFSDVRTGGWTGRVSLLPEHLLWPRTLAPGSRVFVNSMFDLFHEGFEEKAIRAIFGAMQLFPGLWFQALTKRADRAFDFFASTKPQECTAALEQIVGVRAMRDVGRAREREWPPSNVWIGVSIEDRVAAARRLPPLLGIKGAVRWVSCEPLLEELDLGPWIGELDWIVAGGESGAGARPMHPGWSRSLRDQARRAGVPFFFKQWGAYCETHAETEDSFLFRDGKFGSARIAPWAPRREIVGRLLDGRTWGEMPRAKR